MVRSLVIEFHGEFAEGRKAMTAHLVALRRKVSRLGGGEGVDYEEAMASFTVSAGLECQCPV